MDKFRIMHKELLNSGVYFGPSGYEVGFISEAHTDEILDQAAAIICQSLDCAFVSSEQVKA